MEERERTRRDETIVSDRTQEPKQYQVNILNDDFTTFEFVIDVVMSVFFKSLSEAEEIANITHAKGKAAVGVYSYDIAHSKVAKAVALARAQNFPLRFEVVPFDKLRSYNNQ